MSIIKVAAGTINTTPLAWESNRKHIVNAIEDARQQEISLLCLPELIMYYRLRLRRCFLQCKYPCTGH